MNGPCPIYIVYRHDVPELRYAWARDELRRIEGLNTDWRSQESITLRFFRILDDDAAVEIHGRILREGPLRGICGISWSNPHCSNQ
jgi:hypothetical protein